MGQIERAIHRYTLDQVIEEHFRSMRAREERIHRCFDRLLPSDEPEFCRSTTREIDPALLAQLCVDCES